MNSPGLFLASHLSLLLTQVKGIVRETWVLPHLNPHEAFLRGDVV